MIFKILQLACYILAMFPCFIVARSIDYTKIMKVKSNIEYYLAFIVISLLSSFLLGEFLYKIITLFVK